MRSHPSYIRLVFQSIAETPQKAAGLAGCQERPASADKCIDELGGAKSPEVVESLSDPDQLDRNGLGLCDGGDDASLCGSIELGQDEAGQIKCRIKGSDLDALRDRRISRDEARKRIEVKQY